MKDLTGKDVLRYIDDITVLTVTKNATFFVDRMYSSLVKQIGGPLPAVVVNNGEQHVPVKYKSWFREIDNNEYRLTKTVFGNPDFGKKVLDNQAGCSHSTAVDFGLWHAVYTRYCMLTDDDILFKPSILDLLNLPAAWNAVGDVNGQVSWFCSHRLKPFMCVIDVDKMKKQEIHYYVPGKHDSRNTKWDTGGHFLMDIHAHGWKINFVDYTDFILHFKSGTIKPEKTKELLEDFYTRHSDLWK